MTHTLFLIRHGIAAERGSEWPDDTLRPLTDRGVSRLAEEACGLVKMGMQVDLILASPLVRARQTAGVLASVLPDGPPVVVTPALRPGARPAELVEVLARRRRARRVALVGHETGIGQLAAWLIGAGRGLRFKKGSVARIDIEARVGRGEGELIWLASPRMLRAIR